MSDTRTIEVLRGARELISDPERWTRGTLARDKDDCVVRPQSPAAVKWCVVGALYHECPAGLHPLQVARCIRSALNALSAATSANPSDVNDNGGHKRVLALCARAIARLEKTA